MPYLHAPGDYPDAIVEIARMAAALVLDEGLHFKAAIEKSAKEIGVNMRHVRGPDTALMDWALREHIALFCPNQFKELRALREIALLWMRKMASFNPMLGGLVWHGQATRNHDVFIGLFTDDPKSPEIALIDAGADFEPTQQIGMRSRVYPALSLVHHCGAAHRAILGDVIGVHFLMYGENDLRGALLPDALGRKPRGNIAAVQALLDAENNPN